MTANNFIPSAYLAIANGFMSDWIDPKIRPVNHGPAPKNPFPCSSQSKYAPHQGIREKARRVRQGKSK